MFDMIQNISLNKIETAPIPQQISVSQITKNITSQPENLMAADISTSANILAQLTIGATMNAEVIMLYSAMHVDVCPTIIN